MDAHTLLDDALDGRPAMLTVAEAARRLRIGRTLAYQLTARYLAGEPGGIPAVKLGGCVRVPSDALVEFTRTGHVRERQQLNREITALVDADLADVVPPQSPHRPDRTTTARQQSASWVQLTLDSWR